MVIVNVVPLSGTDSSDIFPLSLLIISEQIKSPRPEPVAVLEALWNILKTFF
jgi:hypothetical protein